MVAKIREEGLQRSQVMEYESYMTDVLGARLTNSEDMQRAQRWLEATMGQIGLVNVAAEPFMDYGVTWDNEYFSLQMLEPDYSPMVGYPIAYTRGTDGRQVASAVIVDLQVEGRPREVPRHAQGQGGAGHAAGGHRHGGAHQRRAATDPGGTRLARSGW